MSGLSVDPVALGVMAAALERQAGQARAVAGGLSRSPPPPDPRLAASLAQVHEALGRAADAVAAALATLGSTTAMAAAAYEHADSGIAAVTASRAGRPS